ncbi:helix-turn-helix domain-containing protein [Paenibacillus polymyxa]|uniref:helix-turn-helix domain-containing protein n=1 Tax=Paenibacillus polymyxa TaxID=1406 RepID=UPI0003663168|nr:helix-turn-helix transcriptional regulator [Paenibacillus polymyxa]NMP10591.1 helix-turn-helix transcriptional regulator [Paenibacillus polymyxa]
MKVSEQMRPLINEKGLNPSDLAHLVGCSPQYMHNLLNGSRRWNETTLRKACDALGLEIKLVPKKLKKNNN